MYTHWIKVFNRTDDDAVVVFVTDHFHLVLFPAEQRFLDQQLVGGRGLQAALADGLEFFRVVGNAAARAAKREAGSDDGGKAHFLLHGPGFVHAVGDAAARRPEADARHRVLELQAVFGLVDGLGLGADQLDVVLGQHAVAPQVERAVERGLATHGGQDGVGALLGDDFLDRLPGDRLDVGHVGRRRVGHDRGGVAVDQDDAVTLFAQRLAGLHAGIVELARLANDDGAGADDENALEVGTFGHISRFNTTA